VTEEVVTVSNLLPWLLLAACPLAMLLMMRGMSGGGSRRPDEADAAHSPGTTQDARIAELEAQVRLLTGRADPSDSADEDARSVPPGSSRTR
jgi:hypothetical protein